ncbi:hypothetical protein [Shewanella decolorationis]|uniref:hypothetical protein n=1 Tax=Shewanella decolorationis TaxID=256839 RepID=UPI0010574D59|nr:hypothetical protein [Shewanella decolorationis]
MEPIPLSQMTNASLITAGAQSDVPNANFRPIPAEVQLSPEGDSIILNGTEYNLKLVNALQRQVLLNASQLLVNPIPAQTTESSSVSQTNQLLALGTTVNLKLPDAIILLAQQNGIQQSKLYAFAARPQGYPLPNVIVNEKTFQFANGAIVQQDPGTRLNAGEYQAKIALYQGKPILVLTPILSKLEIQIGAPINETQLPTFDKQSTHIVMSKMEPVQIITQFLRKLEGLVSQSDASASIATTKREVIPETKTQIVGNATDVPLFKNKQADNTASLSLSTEPKLTTGQQNLEQSNKFQNLESKVAGSQLKENLNERAAIEAKNATNMANALLTQNNKSDSTGPQAKVSSLLNGLSTKEFASDATLQNLKTQPQVDISNTRKLHTEENTMVNQVLQKAFTKAGALPIDQMLVRSNTNLAAELLKLLPHLSPSPLGQLSDPSELKAQILGLATLNLATPQLNQASTLFNAGAITSLFQLLLGFRANNSNNSMSAKLADYLEQLQAKIGLSSHQLNQFSKAGGLESMGQLASSLQLYQQASSENNGNLVWFFALPYGINQRHEQLEGKFEREADNDEQQKHKGWHLQLKFNLAQGPLLIAARFHQQVLDIQFKGDNKQLLSRVDNFLAPLGQKLSQLGFTPGELSTQLAPIPATLLPGDHFLVKTRA